MFRWFELLYDLEVVSREKLKRTQRIDPGRLDCPGDTLDEVRGENYHITH